MLIIRQQHLLRDGTRKNLKAILQLASGLFVYNDDFRSPKKKKFLQGLYAVENHGVSMQLNSYQVWNLLKERTLNRSLASSETQDNLLKKKNSLTPFKTSQVNSGVDGRISMKNRNIFKEADMEEKQNSGQQINAQYQKNRSAIFKKNEINLRQFMQQGITQPPYFIQCLKRKNIVSTQICMHIHNSLMTFKQYLRTAQMVKAKTPDQKIPAQREGRKTIVFDMDETLIHTSEIMMKGYEIKVPFKSMNGKVISGYVNVRPHAKDIIKNMSKYFDVIIFTAGNQCYADPILDHIDPERKIQYRLYRDSCTMVNNQLFVKDLRILGRKLENVVLVDNAPYSYMMQLSNGIPILNYLKGKQDDQLIKLEPYLMSLLQIQDVRPLNSATFRKAQYIRYDNYQKLIQDLYGKYL